MEHVSIGFVCPDLTGCGLQVERACSLIEGHISGERFEFTFGEREEFEPIADRRAYLEAQYQPGASANPPMLCNRNDSRAITLSSNFEPNAAAEGRVGCHFITLSLPGAAAPDLPRLMVAVGDALTAYRSGWTPIEASHDMVPVIFSNVSVPSLSPRQIELSKVGLPRYRRQWRASAIHLPDRVNWLNYWSRLTCNSFDFPSAANDKKIFAVAKRTSADAWFLQLTEAPLDLSRNDHVGALKRAYDRFPLIAKDCAPPQAP